MERNRQSKFGFAARSTIVSTDDQSKKPILGDERYSMDSKIQVTSFDNCTETTSSSTSSFTIEDGSKRKSARLVLPAKYLLIGVFLLIMISAIFIESTLLLMREFHHKGTAIVLPIEDPSTPTPPVAKPRSCLDLKKAGQSFSGVYKIFNSADVAYEVYCDMETDEGGWTLVAAVHEDDIRSKCDSNDRWSTYATLKTCGRGKTAWENKVTFGNLDKCTSDDYKNHAYHSLDAKDVMIWHVPDDTPLKSIKNESLLRYRTTDNFLSDNGGNLLTFFRDYYELNIRGNYKSIHNEKVKYATTKTADVLGRQSEMIKSNIPQWFRYDEWGGWMMHDYMHNGYLYEDEGNWVIFNASLQSETLVYGREYWWGRESNFSIITKTTHPFYMVGAIRNEDEEFSYFETTINTNHYTESESHFIFRNELELGNYKLQYRGAYFPMEYYDVVCEYHFIVYNEKDWFSKKPTSFELDKQVMYQVYRKFGFKVDGSPTNFVMGYVLLASKNGSSFSQDTLDDVGRTILSTYAELPYLFNDFGGSDGFSVPVTFDEGDENTVLQMVPEKLRKYVEPGFLQLRAYNKIGFPKAFCPGVRMKSHYADYTCIGGVSDDISENGTCGDYSDFPSEEKSPGSGSGNASKLASIERREDTTLLIFYR